MMPEAFLDPVFHLAEGELAEPFLGIHSHPILAGGTLSANLLVV